MVEEIGISGFTDEEYAKYTAVALPLVRDDEVFPLGRFEDLVGLPHVGSDSPQAHAVWRLQPRRKCQQDDILQLLSILWGRHPGEER